MWTIEPPLLFAAGNDWLRYLDDLLPIILVVLIGILTLVKRGVEIMMKKRASKPSDRSGSEEEPEGEKTVFQEMRRYFEILEGKRARSGPGTPPVRTEEPAPPVEDPSLEPEPWAEAPAGELREPSFHELAHLATHVDPHLDPHLSKLPVHLPPSGSAPTTGRPEVSSSGLSRIRLGRGSRQIRKAILWSEIINNPRHKGPF